jgi:hypothetical protein
MARGQISSGGTFVVAFWTLKKVFFWKISSGKADKGLWRDAASTCGDRSCANVAGRVCICALNRRDSQEGCDDERCTVGDDEEEMRFFVIVVVVDC